MNLNELFCNSVIIKLISFIFIPYLVGLTEIRKDLYYFLTESRKLSDYHLLFLII